MRVKFIKDNLYPTGGRVDKMHARSFAGRKGHEMHSGALETQPVNLGVDGRLRKRAVGRLRTERDVRRSLHSSARVNAEDGEAIIRRRIRHDDIYSVGISHIGHQARRNVPRTTVCNSYLQLRVDSAITSIELNQ